ncbi:MAG: autotransporter domain-containing protein, partial [Verrucomicrobiia bacterium]
FTLLSGTGVAGFDLNNLSFTHTIPQLSGTFSIVGSDLQFTTTIATLYTWDGGAGTGNWTDAANWNPDIVPIPGDALIFTGSTQTTVDTQANRTTGTITFDENADAFTLNNNIITLGGALTNQSTNLQTLNSGFTFNHNGVINAAAGDFLLSGAVALSNNTTTRTLTFTGPGTTTVNGIISNGPSAASGNLLKTGTGTLILNGLNTYSGSTTLVNGITQISNTANLGNGSATNTLIFNGGTLQLTANIPSLNQSITLQSTGTIDTDSHNLGIGTVISGPGGFTKLGTGQLLLSGANTYEGLTHLAQGSIQMTHSNALGSTADGTLVESGARLSLFNVDVGNETLLINGNGLLGSDGALSSLGNDSWAGAILLGSTSLIQVSGVGFTASGPIFLGTSTLTVNNVAPTTFTGTISGSGGLTKLGAADLFLTGNNTFIGTTTISNGNLILGNGGTSGSLSGPIVNNNLLTVNRSDTVVLPGVISGTGQLHQNGTGTTILTGNNTLSGSTEINNGTLQIGNGGTTGSLPGPIVNNAALRFNRSDIHTHTGLISGFGTLTQAGSGTLILPNANTYLGTTNVANGILRITNSNALGSGPIVVQGGATLELSGGVTLPVSTTLSLFGTLQNHSDDNTFLADLILPANASISNIAPGTTLTLGTTSFTESIDTGGFTLNLIGPGDIFLNSAINGTGQVVKTGSGTVTFFADENFYTGPTTVNEGTLILDTLTDLNGAIKGTLLTIGNNAGTPQSAIVQLGATLAPVANEMINDTAQVLLFSDGLLNLNSQTETIGSLQFTGGTVLTGTGGSLRFDPGTPAGGITTNPSASTALIDATGGSLHLNGDRTFNIALGGGTADLEIRGPIVDGTASSGLTKQGQGILLLNGTNTYTGNTDVLGGELRVEGSLASPLVTIGNGATLGGSGTLLGSLVIQSGGLLSPGSSPGILNVGALTLLPGSITLFEIDGLIPGTQHDQIQVVGNASLAGTAQILFGGGFTPSDGDTFTLIQAGSVTGTYDTLVSNLGAIFALDTIYTPTTFQLAIRVTQLDYTTFALNQNQFNVAANLDTFSRTGQMPELITLLNSLDAANLANALQQISPDQFGLMNTLAKQYNRAQGRNLFNRLSEWRISGGGIAGTVSTSSLRLLDWTSQPVIAGTKLRDYTPVSLDSIQSPGWSLFASGTGQFGDIQGDGNGSGYDFTTAGMTVGIDRKITRLGDGDLIGGFYAGYAGSTAKLDGAGGRVETDGGKFGVFGSWINEGLYLNAQVGGGVANYTTRRNVLGQRQTGETTGTELITDLQLGHEWQKVAWRFGPELGLSYSYVGINRFTERGGLAPLQIQEQNNHSLQTRLGWQTSYEWNGKNDWWIRPAANLSWAHEFLDPAPSIDGRFASGAGGIFSVNPTEVGRDTAILGLTTTFGQGTRWSGWIGYEAEVGDRMTIHTLNAGAAFKF